MKLVVAWLTMAIVAVIAASSCSIRHASDQFECAKQSDCSDGRMCVDGYCVVGPGGILDAAKVDGNKGPPDARPDARVCPDACTSCEVGPKNCTVDCALRDCTGGNAIVCPAGWNCEVLCSTANSCRNGVSCANTLSCDVQCTGSQACRGVTCGTGTCNVNCSGNGACRGVHCDQSCACDVTCGAGSLCTEVFCTTFFCDNQQGGCTSGTPSCDTCP